MDVWVGVLRVHGPELVGDVSVGVRLFPAGDLLGVGPGALLQGRIDQLTLLVRGSPDRRAASGAGAASAGLDQAQGSSRRAGVYSPPEDVTAAHPPHQPPDLVVAHLFPSIDLLSTRRARGRGFVRPGAAAVAAPSRPGRYGARSRAPPTSARW